MKRNLFLFTCIAAAIILLSACGKNKGGSTGLLVPEDAAVVVHINNASLSSKLSWDEIQQSNWYRELSKETKDTMAKQLLSDPSISGVDAKSDFVFFFKNHGKGAYLAVEGKVKDVTVFENFVKSKAEGAQPVKSGDITSLATPSEGVLSWNKSHFVYIANMDAPNTMNAGVMGRGNNNEQRTAHKFSNDSLTYFGKETLTLSETKRLDKDSRFADMIKDGSDMHLWMNSGGYYKEMMGPMMSMMGDMGALLKDNVSASSINFDKGKITMDSKQFYGAKLTSLFSKYKSKDVSADMAGRIPSQNVVAALVMNYPPEAIKEFLKIANLEGMANMALMSTGYNIDEFVKANKGDLILAVTDLQMKSDTMDMGGGKTFVSPAGKPDMKIIFGTSVNDKASFEKLVTLLWQQTKGMPMGGVKDAITYKIENNWFAASNSSEMVSQFLAGNGPKSSVSDKLSGHPINMFIDIQKILQATSTSSSSDSSAKAIMDASLQTWQDITAYGGEFKDKAFTFHAEVNMIDKSTNSLKSLNAYLDKIYMSVKDKRKDMDMADIEYPKMDTTAMPDIRSDK